MTTPPQLPPPVIPAPHRRPFYWPAALVLVTAIAALTLLAIVWLTKRAVEGVADRAGKAGAALAHQAVSLAENFRSGRITQTFVASLPTLTAAPGGRLEVATLDDAETLRLEDERSVLWDALSLGRTVSEIRIPVTYRYYLQLNDPWQIEVAGQTCLVTAPPIRASLPPAIHTDRMEKRSEAGWARFNAREQMDALEHSITPTLEHSAADPKRLALVRETARRTVAEFIRNWLLREDHWRTDRFRTIKVVFADEASLELDPSRHAPSTDRAR